MPVYAWPKIETFAISLRCNSFSQTMQLSKSYPALRRGNPIVRQDCSRLVGVPGIEPGTSSLSGTRSNQLSYTPAPPQHRPQCFHSGGGSRGRTGDIQLAKLALYQLSYAPGGRLYSTRAQALLGPLSRSGRDAEDIELVPAGLMWKALPLFPPTRGVSPSPAPCGAASP